MPGTHGKNLFLKDKKSGDLFAVAVVHSQAVDLKTLAKLLNVKEFRFGDDEALSEHLGVAKGPPALACCVLFSSCSSTPPSSSGCVTPFAAINDKLGKVRSSCACSGNRSCLFLIWTLSG